MMFRTTAMTLAVLAAIDHLVFDGLYTRILEQGLATLIHHLQ
ncbi:MAG TPA: hypothetical protein VKW08_00765 [Xanthobacteraceae bacterium]|jgi:hypothetical protein|nr:hypothetical protein [Xanthobacteraceae bacterium]